jgi:transcriptional regulator with XRE-family HTH domain
MSSSIMERVGNSPLYHFEEEVHTMATVRELREQAGWNQAELAVRAGVSVSSVSRIENGRKPNKGTLKLIANALGVDVSEITIIRTGESGQ